MTLLISAISLFTLGWVINDLLPNVPTLVVVAVALVAQVGVIVLNNKRGKK